MCYQFQTERESQILESVSHYGNSLCDRNLAGSFPLESMFLSVCAALYTTTETALFPHFVPGNKLHSL